MDPVTDQIYKEKLTQVRLHVHRIISFLDLVETEVEELRQIIGLEVGPKERKKGEINE